MNDATVWAGGALALCGALDLWYSEKLERNVQERSAARIIRYIGYSEVVCAGALLAVRCPQPAWVRVGAVAGAFLLPGLLQLGTSFWVEGYEDASSEVLIQYRRNPQTAAADRQTVDRETANHAFYKSVSLRLLDIALVKIMLGVALTPVAHGVRYLQSS